MEADFDEREAARRRMIIDDLSSEEESEDERPKRGKRRKKHDSDYDDDWFESKGHKLFTQDGKVKKLGRPPGRRGRPPTNSKKEKEKLDSPVTSKERDPLSTSKPVAKKPVQKEIPKSNGPSQNKPLVTKPTNNVNKESPKITNGSNSNNSKGKKHDFGSI